MSTERKNLHIFSTLKENIQKNGITIINATLTIVLIATISIALLSSASNLQRTTIMESMNNLAGKTAKDIQVTYQSYVDIARTAAQILEIYPTMDASLRRELCNDTLFGILMSNQSIVSMYTVWKPNALDGLDAQYANTAGTDETGILISCHTRETGSIVLRPFYGYKILLEQLSNEETITNPVPQTINSKETFVFDIRVPITIGNNTVGIVGVTIAIDSMQALVENVRPYPGSAVMVFANNGIAVVHPEKEMRVLNLAFPPVSNFDQDSIYDFLYGIHQGDEMTLRVNDRLALSYPIQLGNTKTPWAVLTTIPFAAIMAPIYNLVRFSVFFIAGAGLVAALVMFLTSNNLSKRARFLHAELERASTMRDNLKYGLFLMDGNCIIQSAYSKALENILSVPDLQGKEFVQLLASSLKDSEQRGLKDYFNMVYNRLHDRKMLEEINPINEFIYTCNETREVKNLRSSFTIAERGKGLIYIMGTLEDITAESELEKQLHEAESKRENEMRALFQVIQLDPRVFSDFIEDLEYEFEKINDTLKDESLSSKEAMIEIYQSVHAIKSNALILNLEEFSNVLHEMEDKIKVIRDQDEVPFQDVLHVTMEIEKIMKEKDKLKTTLDKINAFRSSGTSEKWSQDRYVLVETLSKACSKAAYNMNKKAKFVVKELDESVLEYGPRRVIKEVLTQLVRNAVSHGIEDPEERLAMGKEEEGTVQLSIKYSNNKIDIKLADNGRGIDFEKIREKAESLNLLQEGDDINDKNQLLKVIFLPDFSTAKTTDLNAGRGVGLSLVKERVRDLRGVIKLQSDLGKGTVFHISIPLEMPAATKVVS
jgi:two-component system chemotaxis sensor kinase CheA